MNDPERTFSTCDNEIARYGLNVQDAGNYVRVATRSSIEYRPDPITANARSPPMIARFFRACTWFAARAAPSMVQKLCAKMMVQAVKRSNAIAPQRVLKPIKTEMPANDFDCSDDVAECRPRRDLAESIHEIR